MQGEGAHKMKRSMESKDGDDETCMQCGLRLSQSCGEGGCQEGSRSCSHVGSRWRDRRTSMVGHRIVMMMPAIVAQTSHARAGGVGS